MKPNNSHAKAQRRKASELLFIAPLRLCVMLLLIACISISSGFAQAGRIYTQPDPKVTGAITGRASEQLSHAIAVEHDRVHVFLAALSNGGREFRFEHLPVGKYDLVLFTKSAVVYEGLVLGVAITLTETSANNFDKRIALADGFFKTARVHRIGISSDGETLLAFVERFRASNILKQSGEALGEMVRRFEIIELARATDDWQMTASRHLYREGEPIVANPQFWKHINVPTLGDLRIINATKDLGEIDLPKPASN